MSFAITPESNERKGVFMKRKWWHDKVAYQIYPKSFWIQTEMELAT